MQSDLLRGLSVSCPLNGDGHVHRGLSGGDRLAERVRRGHLGREHPLVGHGPGPAARVNPASHVDRAPVLHLRGDGRPGHRERRVVQPQVDGHAAGDQQHRGKRRPEPPSPGPVSGTARWELPGPPDLLGRDAGPADVGRRSPGNPTSVASFRGAWTRCSAVGESPDPACPWPAAPPSRGSPVTVTVFSPPASSAVCGWDASVAGCAGRPSPRGENPGPWVGERVGDDDGRAELNAGCTGCPWSASGAENPSSSAQFAITLPSPHD